MRTFQRNSRIQQIRRQDFQLLLAILDGVVNMMLNDVVNMVLDGVVNMSHIHNASGTHEELDVHHDVDHV